MRIFFTGLLCFLCALAYAGNFDLVTLKISPVSTNATLSQAVSDKITGYIERNDITFSVSTNSVYVKMFASNELSGKITTIYTEKSTATDVSYNPAIERQHISGTTVGTNASMNRIALYNEKVYLVATNATAGYDAQTIKSFLIYEAK